ncbi:MAG: type II toxin-antitoxin system Phd/YefM family antitoxin [Bdellovibrionales bacterium]|nr:type II toxin-antitoxin system Phd/YefM family antitoxin [Bdellovibrionales bacterium]
MAEFKSQAAALLDRINTASQPLLITQNGKPAGVLEESWVNVDLMPEVLNILFLVC